MKKLAFFIVAACIFLYGCATTSLKNVPTTFQLNPQNNTSLVFGKIALYEGFKQWQEYGLFLVNLDSEKKNNFEEMRGFDLFGGGVFSKTPKARYFFIELSAGNYKIEQFKLVLPNTLRFSQYIPTDIRFDVQPNSLVYVGTLKVHEKNPGWMINIPAIFEVSNEKEEAVKELNAKYPQLKDEVKTNLMVIHQVVK